MSNLKAEAAMSAVLENAKRACIESEGKMFGPDPFADAVLGNAERLLADAAILAQHGSYRTALSLAALSFEEIGKSCIVRWRNAGLLSRNIQKEMASHKTKQRVFCAYVYAKALYNFISNEKEPLSRFRDLGESAMLLIHDGESKKTLFTEAIFWLIDADEFLRCSGFYQDLNEDQGGFDFKVLYNQMRERASKSLVMARADPSTQTMTAYFYEWARMQTLDGTRETRLKKILKVLEPDYGKSACGAATR